MPALFFAAAISFKANCNEEKQEPVVVQNPDNYNKAQQTACCNHLHLPDLHLLLLVACTEMDFW